MRRRVVVLGALPLLLVAAGKPKPKPTPTPATTPTAKPTPTPAMTGGAFEVRVSRLRGASALRG